MTRPKSTAAPAKRKGLELDEEDLAMLGARGLAHEAGTHLQRRERHDRGYLPRGWKFEDGRLLHASARAPVTAADVRMLRELERFLVGTLGGGGRGHWEEVTDKDIAGVQITRDGLQGARAFFQALCGCEYEEKWVGVLAAAFGMHAHARTRERLGATGVVVPRAAQIANVARQSGAPRELSAAMIEAVLPTVNLGGKGGRGKAGRTPKAAARYLADKLRERERKLGR